MNSTYRSNLKAITQANKNYTDTEVAEVQYDLLNNLYSPIIKTSWFIYGASPYDVRADYSSKAKSLIVPISPSVPIIIEMLSDARFRVGTFESYPEIGSTPLQYYALDNTTRTYFVSDESANYMMIWFYSPSLSAYDYATALNGINININGVNYNAFKGKTFIDLYSEDGYYLKNTYISGSSPYRVGADLNNDVRCVIFNISANTTYVVNLNYSSYRFTLATYTDVEAFSTGATNYARNHTVRDSNVYPYNYPNILSITSGESDTLLVVWYYSGIYDTNISPENIVVNVYNEDVSTLLHTFKYPYYENTIVNSNVEPLQDDINGITLLHMFIYGANPYYVATNLDTDNRCIVFNISSSTTYKIVANKNLARFSCATYTGVDGFTSATSYFKNFGGSILSITSGESDTLLVVWYYSRTSDTNVSPEDIVVKVYNEDDIVYNYYNNGKTKALDTYARKLIDNDFYKITVATWNIGHFSLGGSSSTIDDDDYADKLTEFRTLINTVNADLFHLQEYSSIFAYLTDGNVTAEDVLFQNYTNSIIGSQSRYSCNAIYNNIHLLDALQQDYDCNQDAEITHTTAILATDYYYQEGILQIGDKTIHIVNTHCAFDLNNTEVETNQYAELIEKFGDYEYVIITGDFNPAGSADEFQVFADAGFTLANYGYMGSLKTYPTASAHNGVLDNIIVKGFAMSNIEMVETELSDHYLLKCDLTLK